MLFQETKIPGAYVVQLEPIHDERGFFARSWFADELKIHGLNPRLAQCSIAFNHRKGTLRGMHYQLKPFEEAKLVRCTMGSIYDVVLDLRKKSPTFLKWDAFRVSSKNRKMVYIPEGCAHGYLTLERSTEVLYMTSKPYSPPHYRGARWDDPAFQIRWPMKPLCISKKDLEHPDFPAPPVPRSFPRKKAGQRKSTK